jgi:hypothetical protein
VKKVTAKCSTLQLKKPFNNNFLFDISIGICARNHFPFFFLGWLSDVVVAGHVSLFFVDQQKTTKRHYSRCGLETGGDPSATATKKHNKP